MHLLADAGEMTKEGMDMFAGKAGKDLKFVQSSENYRAVKGDGQWWREVLYTTGDAYWLISYGDSGAAPCHPDMRRLSNAEAKAWAYRNMPCDQYDELFGGDDDGQG